MRITGKNKAPQSRHGARAAVGLALTGLALSSCTVEQPLTEAIPVYPVPTETSVSSTRLPGEPGTGPVATPSVSETPGPGTAEFTVCFGAFVDYPQGILTVNPLAEPVKGRDPKLLNPLIVHFNDDGTSQINPRVPYEPGTYTWLDSKGRDVGNFPPSSCEDKDIHVAQIVRAESDRPGSTPVIAAPNIEDGDVLAAWTPKDVADAGLYHQTFRFSNPDQLLELRHSMAAG